MQEMRHHRSRNDQRVRRRAIARVVRLLALTVALGVIGFLVAGSVAGSSTRTNATVSLRKTALGAILVNSRGRTLYLFAKDRNGRSACSGSCARFWPPLLSRDRATGGPGVKASLLGTTVRTNGARQVTYNRHPLYTYALDTRAGQTRGEGSLNFGARWWAVSARGTAVVKAQTSSTTPIPTTPTTTTCFYPPCP